MSPTPDDLLALARFCWSRRKWTTETGDGLVRDYNEPDVEFLGDHRDDVSAAEAVLIERGLGEEYAQQLILALGDRVPGFQIHDDARISLHWAAVTNIRTAPLEVCVRAMVEVVRQEEEKRG